MRYALPILVLAVATGLNAEKPSRKDILAPKVVKRCELEYTDAARKAGIQGRVRLKATVDENGRTMNIRVVNVLGYGLDEKAIECLRQWRFRPATRDGDPVSVPVTVELGFSLP